MKYLTSSSPKFNMAFFKFSSLVNIKDFKKEMTSTLDVKDISLEENVRDRSKLLDNITQDTLQEVEDVCSPSNLKCEDVDIDGMDATSKTIYLSETNLATLNVLPESRSCRRASFKQKNYIILSEQLQKAKAAVTGHKIDGPEVVLSVALYHPVKLRKVQEFLVLGRQTLTDLRDKIYCPADSIVVGEHSENPDFARIATGKDICPSAFIFIESVFYNDTRSDLCRDYSKLIMDWTNKKHNGELPRYGVCSSKKMEETKFEDLTIKLGYPYVFVHQGDCEHLLLFRDLRMLHADDPQDVCNYPFHIFRPRPKRQRCMICSIYSARWLTRDDLLMSEDPSLFCEKCFKALHYRDNQKAYPFSAYQYSGDYYW